MNDSPRAPREYTMRRHPHDDVSSPRRRRASGPFAHLDDYTDVRCN